MCQTLSMELRMVSKNKTSPHPSSACSLLHNMQTDTAVIFNVNQTLIKVSHDTGVIWMRKQFAFKIV